MRRSSGILLPISSLPSNYGIGCFSKEAYKFVDMLAEAGQSFWQILPLGPTSYGDSPYQSFSTFAGNPYFINLEDLIKCGWLKKSKCDKCDFVSHINYIEYEKIYKSRFTLLKKAYLRSKIKDNDEYKAFCIKESGWLDDYANFMAIKDSLGGISWVEWPNELKLRKEDELNRIKVELADDIEFYKFQQFLFSKQWNDLKCYANSKGIKIIGDIPIYVALDSADTWASPELFQFNDNGEPTGVAGCPPDAFSETGQLWGNPLYDWEYHEKHEFTWWIKRVSHCLNLYDYIRIDHFRGFDEYYNIPFGALTAQNGHWDKGPGMKLFNKLADELGNNLNIIAEDLGYLTPSVYELLADTGYPGMKVLHFAFDSSENSTYLPHKYKNNCVVYAGTHDNDTTKGWYKSLAKEEKNFVRDYLGITKKQEELVTTLIIRAAMQSPADLAVISMQDYLGLGSEARINIPSTIGNNWKWRMSKKDINSKLAKSIYRITKIYSRL